MEMDTKRRRESFTFVAYVSGPMIKYDLVSESFDEAYSTGKRLLEQDLKGFEGKVEVTRVELTLDRDKFL
jgi:hypothetical protein